MRPRLLDLFCGEGGAAMGYHQAGFEVVGVDSNPAVGRRYPFRFICTDALDYLGEYGQMFHAIHASPPCQAHSQATVGMDRSGYPRLIAPTRAALRATGRPWIIENVDGAFFELQRPITLCGTMFGLSATDTDGAQVELRRHRLFESNLELHEPGYCRHGEFGERVAGAYGGGGTARPPGAKRGGYVPAVPVQRALLGTPWMSYAGVKQAIPPAYTAYLGAQLLAACPVRTS